MLLTYDVYANVDDSIAHCRMAEKHGMKLVLRQPFADYFNEHHTDREHRSLLMKMKALEVQHFVYI